MKKDIHPDYKPVVFYDTQSEFKFLTKSTMTSSETIEWEDGNTYPVIKVEVSSAFTHSIPVRISSWILLVESRNSTEDTRRSKLYFKKIL